MNSMKLQETRLKYRNLVFSKHYLWTIKRESKKTILFKITSKTIKYLRINLTKKVKDLYDENSKTLMKEGEDNTKK